jgi:Tfp pilus assembly major pilin PilA
MKTQKGFTVVEGLLILVIIGLISFTGWYVWNAHNKTNNTLTNADAANSSVAKYPGNATTLTKDSASRLALQFYDQYINLRYFNDQEKLVGQYGTENLTKYFKDNSHGVDPVVCGQSIPTSISTNNSSVTADSATVVITEDYNPTPLEVTQNLFNQNVLKIDSIDCPSTLPSEAP